MEIKDIKEQLSILTVLEHYGIRPNRNKMVCCPFHDDKNPSMQVYPDTNTVFCFSGNCSKNGKAMDVIQFIQDSRLTPFGCLLIFYIALSASLPSQHKKSSVLFFFK